MFLDRYDSYIILSFVNGTLALFIDETTEARGSSLRTHPRGTAN